MFVNGCKSDIVCIASCLQLCTLSKYPIDQTGGFFMKIYSGHHQKIHGTPCDVVIELENNGCNTSCKSYCGKKVSTKTNYHPSYDQEYQCTTITHICLRIDDVARRREEIYSKAGELADSIPYTFGGSVSRACTKKKEVFESAIDEYRNQPCPFFDS